MDNRRVAAELVRIAKAIIAVDPKALLKDLKSIEIKWAEGDTHTGLPTLKGKKFNSVEQLEKTLYKFEEPDDGYDKVGVVITFKDGSELTGFRYDHGKRDPSFSKQLDWYIRNRVSITD